MNTKIVAQRGRVNWMPGSRGGTLNRLRIAIDGAVVVTLTVTDAGLPPLSDAELGDTEHVASDGVPEHVIATDWLKPACGATLNV